MLQDDKSASLAETDSLSVFCAVVSQLLPRQLQRLCSTMVLAARTGTGKRTAKEMVHESRAVPGRARGGCGQQNFDDCVVAERCGMTMLFLVTITESFSFNQFTSIPFVSASRYYSGTDSPLRF